MGINALLVQFGSESKHYIRVAGSPPACNLGWAQFAWGSKQGRLHPLNFESSIVFPEAQGATGGYIRSPLELTYTAKTLDEPGAGWSATTQLGVYNQLRKVWTGIGGGRNGAAFNPGSVSSTNVSAIAASDAGLIVLNPPQNTQNAHTAGQQQVRFNVYAIMLDWVCNIAQQACMYNAAETFVPYSSFTGNMLCNPPSGYVRSATINCSKYLDISAYRFGSSGALMLGHYAWYYNGSYGPLQAINSAQVWTVPESPQADGIYVMLKPGVVADVDLGVNEFLNTSLQTSLGQVNTAAKIFTGLYPNL